MEWSKQGLSTATAAESCPSCGAPMAGDQRYCLQCGRRRGEPRLPFMDAVVFMNATRRPGMVEPSPPPRKRRRLSPNAALIAGVGTLLLAMGVGVLIGRSGNESTTATAPQPVQVVKLGGGESGKTAKASSSEKTIGGGSSKASRKPVAPEQAAHPAAEEVLKPTGDVKLPPPTVQPGGKCPPGSAGCENGKFTGDFFGE
jgi:hypothetical protein